MTKTFKRILLSVLATGVVIALAAIAVYFVSGGNAVVRPGNIYVPTGASLQTLVDSLEGSGGQIKNIATFRWNAKTWGLDNVKPGRYVLVKGMSYREVVQMFRRGLQKPVRLTFNNIRTIDRLAGALARQTEPDSLAYLSALSDPEVIRKYGFEPHTFIAMFIPNTYEVYWNVTPEALCSRMKGEYDKFWNKERIDKLAQLNLTQVQAITLASIVYEETKMSDEMARVAGVYVNRLRIGMPLQADPTVKFAVGDPTIRRVLNAHLTTDSPYNTYVYKGLPPGPICMPSIRAIDATLNYEHHNYIYFCAASDFSGYHRFATNLAQHNINAREYANTLNRMGIKK